MRAPPIAVGAKPCAARAPGSPTHCNVLVPRYRGFPSRIRSGEGQRLSERLGIDNVSPVVSCGRYPSKAVVGEHVPIAATVWREGHDAVAATVVWRGPGERLGRSVRMTDEGNDCFGAVVVPDREGLWSFRVDAWADPWASWRHAIEVKIGVGQAAAELGNDLEAGAELLERVGRRPEQRRNRSVLAGAVTALRDPARTLGERVGPALAVPVTRILDADPLRDLITRGNTHRVWVDRPRALFGSWYEFFPRSTGGWDDHGKPVHGTFGTATAALDRVAAMGFDIVYLPPIHPIGTVHRKGANNSVVSTPEDVGSPWAIGSAEGGHDAVHPELGTLADFESFVARTRELGMEVALDFALQCAPDHPWVSEHPEWFTTRPDGSIAYAENPPKRYQDIYPLNFDNDPSGSYAEMLRVLLFWVERGVRIFRVDNPHTKPPDFWHWLIWQVKERYPDVLFLAEAFTRPARLYGLARLGFTQSYTYFTWRTGKAELIEFGTSGRRRRTRRAPTSSSTPRTSCTRRCSTAGLRCSRSGPRSPPPCPPRGACTPASSCSRTPRCGRAARSTWTPRSSSSGRGTSPRRWPAVAPWNRGSPGSTRSAVPIRHCSRSARCASTTPTPTRCSPTPRWTPAPGTPSSAW